MTPAPLSLRAFGHRVLVALLISGILVGALVVAVGRTVNSKVASIPVALIDPSLLRAGGNYLIIGSDTRAFGESKADEEHFGSAASQQGQRSDTMMVAHIDPGSHTGILVSFPRDLWVDIPDHGSSKINAAFAYGGAQLAIRTIEQDFDIPISHYLEVDFAGFRDIVNAIGSVPIYFPTPARDHNTGLLISTPGCHDLNGNDALAYVRSRYYEYESNGRWRYDPTSDLGRIKRQQYFIRSLSRAAIHSVLSSPFKISSVVDKTVKSLTRDESLSPSDLKKLVRAFRDTDPKAFPMYTLPASNGFRGSQSVLLLDAAKAAPTLARLRPAAKTVEQQSTPPPDIAPSAVSVTVQNGSGQTGAAKRTLESLTAAGFQRAAPATDADRSDYQVTEVRYASGAEGKARVVLAHLGGRGKLVAVNSTPKGADVVVVLGRDIRASGGGTTPTAAPATTGTTPRTAASGPTSTTGPPANPGGVMPVAGC